MSLRRFLGPLITFLYVFFNSEMHINNNSIHIFFNSEMHIYNNLIHNNTYI